MASLIYRKNIAIIAYLMLLFLTGCYSFKGTNIPPDVETFYVASVLNSEPNSPINLGLDFREKLIDKIRSESRLDYTETDPDIVFEASIVSYVITSVAPQENNIAAYNQLDITVNVKYSEINNTENTWSQNFSFFDTYSSSENIINVQDRMIENIFDDIVEKVFNKAFTNW